jgi:hypothetical protein
VVGGARELFLLAGQEDRPHVMGLFHMFFVVFFFFICSYGP